MGLFSPAPAPTAPAAPAAGQCVACRTYLPGVLLELRTLPGVEGPVPLCIDTAACRRRWPVEDRAACTAAGGPR